VTETTLTGDIDATRSGELAEGVELNVMSLLGATTMPTGPTGVADVSSKAKKRSAKSKKKPGKSPQRKKRSQ
jgi:hypothetical protein